jgi:hypothetical protein
MIVGWVFLGFIFFNVLINTLICFFDAALDIKDYFIRRKTSKKFVKDETKTSHESGKIDDFLADNRNKDILVDKKKGKEDKI